MIIKRHLRVPFVFSSPACGADAPAKPHDSETLTVRDSTDSHRDMPWLARENLG